MARSRADKPRLSERISSYVASDKPLRDLAGNLSKVAKTAIDEANSLSLEHIKITLNRLPPSLSHPTAPVKSAR